VTASTWIAYGRALLSRRPALAPPGVAVPPLEARAEGVAARAHRLAAYRRVCGFEPGATLPVTYPHVLAAPLHLALLTGPGFPVRPLGLVHVRNRIVALRPLDDRERLDVRCAVDGYRETDRGQEIDLVTEVRAEGALAWSEVSVLLARRRRAAPPAALAGGTAGAAGPATADVALLEVPADSGRRYAAVSGDWNAIHLAPLTARPFGFDRAIAHGMWSLARVAAALAPAAPGGPLTLEASFKAPILMPARVALRSWRAGEALAFALVAGDGARPHVTGALSRAAQAR
jgi:acyl dehydratase